MKIFKFPAFALLVACYIAIGGCSGGSGSSKTTGTGGPNPTSAITLTQTIMVGDAISDNWQWVQSDFGAYVACGGTGSQVDTFYSCFQANFVSVCDSGCQPGAFQQVAPGKQRAVLFVGTEDALNICNGRQQFPSDGLPESIKAIQVLYKMQVWIATIPPVVDKNGNPSCVAAVATVNSEIESVASTYGIKVVNLGGAMTTRSDYDLTGLVSGYYLPSVTGYAAMQSVYEAANQ